MQKIKIFKSVESEMESMQDSINQWIVDSGAKVISLTGNIAAQTPHEHVGSFSASDILIVVLYEEKA